MRVLMKIFKSLAVFTPFMLVFHIPYTYADADNIVTADTIYDNSNDLSSKDDTDLLNQLIEQSQGRVIKLKERVYRVRTIRIDSTIQIVGTGNNTIFRPVKRGKPLNSFFYVFGALNMSNVCIDGEDNASWGVFTSGDLILNSVVLENLQGTDTRPGSGVRHEGKGENSILHLNNCSFRNISGFEDGKVGNYIGANRGVLTNGGDVIIESCSFVNIQGQEDGDCIHINTLPEEKSVWSTKGSVRIENCEFRNFGKRAIKIQASGVMVRNCSIYNDSGRKMFSGISVYGSNNHLQNNLINVSNAESAITIASGVLNSVVRNKIEVDNSVKDGKTWGIVVKSNEQKEVVDNEFTINNVRQFFYMPSVKDKVVKDKMLKSNKVIRVRK